MRRLGTNWTGIVVCLCLGAWAAPGLCADPGPGAAGEFDGLAALWWSVRRERAGSAELAEAKAKLRRRIAELGPERRGAAVAALMDGRAEESVNVAAVEQFGVCPLSVEEVRSILIDENRSFAQRALLKACYSFCRAECNPAVLAEPTRRRMVGLLAERLEKLAGRDVHYGEQRLLVHLCSSVLTRYAHTPQTPGEVRRLLTAMRNYVAHSVEGRDGLGASLRGWLVLRNQREGLMDSVGSALDAMGHWDALVRRRAALRVGKYAGANEQVVGQVLERLGDPRDEVRAAAARVFVFTSEGKGEQFVPAMVRLLVEDRGVVAQAAAAEVIAARAGQARAAVEPLLKALENSTRKPGPKRATSIHRALGSLAPHAGEDQKRRILAVARARITRSPRGALVALQALGPIAMPAVPAVRARRETCDRFLRAYINEHVLPAITGRRPTR